MTNWLTLTLNFHFCQNVTDVALAAIASAFGSSLQVLWLNFMETSVSKDGILVLAKHLPSSVQEFYFDVGDKPENEYKLRCVMDLHKVAGIAVDIGCSNASPSGACALASVQQTFRNADRDGGGRISAEDCLALFRDVFPDWSEIDLNDLFDAAVKNQDGSLNYIEFLDWLYSGPDLRKDRQ